MIGYSGVRPTARNSREIPDSGSAALLAEGLWLSVHEPDYSEAPPRAA
jgi:hypothetical protein